MKGSSFSYARPSLAKLHPHSAPCPVCALSVYQFPENYIGNLVVLLVILRNARMRSRTNFFLANLAIADLCVGVFCVLPRLSHFVSPSWMLGRAMCKFYHFVHEMSYTASITLLTVISIERYIAILYPLQAHQLITVRRLKLALVFIWLISAGYNVPQLIIFDTTTFNQAAANGSSITYCHPMLEIIDRKAFHTANFVVWYSLPLLLMSFMYTRISVALWRSSNQIRLNPSLRGRHKRGQHSEQHPIVKTVSPGQARATCSSNKVSFTRHTDRVCSDGNNQQGNAGFGLPHPQHANSACAQTNSSAQTRHAGQMKHDKRRTYKFRSVSLHSETEFYVERENDRQSTDSNMRNNRLSHETVESNGSSKHRKSGYFRRWFRKSRQQFPQYAPDELSQSDTNDSEIQASSTVGHAHALEHQNSQICMSDVRITPRVIKHSALVARMKVIRLLVAVVISFAICVLPYHVLILMQFWAASNHVTAISNLFPPFAFVILYLNSGLNPILYALLSENFRKSLSETCCSCRRT